MSKAAALRALFLAIMGLVLAFSLFGILVTGPIVVRVPEVRIDPPVSETRLRKSVLQLCEEFSPRDFQHPENLDRAAIWIAERLRLSGLDVETQSYDLPQGSFQNVIGRRTGSDPAAGVVIVGAHYDAVIGSPGADDNASGIAVLLELAATLPRIEPRRTQMFAAFSTAEPPLFRTPAMGSRVFARGLKDAGVRIDLMLSLDGVGYFSDVRDSQSFPGWGLKWLYPRQGDFIAVVGDVQSGRWIDKVKRGMLATGKLPVHSFRFFPRWAPVDFSDHLSFRDLGLPGVMVTDTAFLRYPHYHRPQDTPHRLDYTRMAELVRGLHGVLLDDPD